MSTPQKAAVGRRYRKAVRVVPRMLAMIVLLYALALAAYFGKYRVRPRHHHAPDLPAVLREGEIETSSARRLLCSAAPLRYEPRGGSGAGGARAGGAGDARAGGSAAETRGGSGSGGGASGGEDATIASASNDASFARRFDDRPVPRGSFAGPARAFDPPSDREPFLNATDARVFLLTGVSASYKGDPAGMLERWLDHYVDDLRTPRQYVLVVVHAPSPDDRSPDAVAARAVSKTLADILTKREIFFDTYEGEAILFSTAAHHFEHRLAAVADDADWVVLVDLDEHIAVPATSTLPAFLGEVDAMGYSLVHGAWVDRVAEGGETNVGVPKRNGGDKKANAQSVSDAFPLRCSLGSCHDPHHVGFRSSWERDFDSKQNGHGGVNSFYALRGLHHYSTLVGVVGGGRRVLAHRAQYPILDVRTLQDFGLDDVVSAARLMEDHESAYPVPLKVMHYQWTNGVVDRLRERARKYSSCHLLDQEASIAALAERLERNANVLNRDACPEMTCVRETFVDPSRSSRVFAVGASSSSSSSSGSNARRASDSSDSSSFEIASSRLTDDDESTESNAARVFVDADELKKSIPILNDDDVVGNGGAGALGYGAERRVIIFASVWEHVDGVSRTMKRLAHHLRSRADSRVFVMSPDLVESDFREAATHERYHVTDVPHIPMPGRGEYKMAAPLQQRQRHQMETFAPHVVHVAAPDMLGHSAVRWAAENDVCSVCSYHTAYDTYLQYYRVGVLATPLRQMLSGFYSSCDVVATPSYAAAEHLSEMGVPRERMGFFPRGINRTMYSPARRSVAFRRDVFGVGEEEGVSSRSTTSDARGGRKSGPKEDGITRRPTDGAGASRDGEVVILWVARIVREKGLGAFVKTGRELFQKEASGEITGLPPFRVVVAGDGPDLPWTRRQLDPKTFPRVRILGHAGGDRLAEIYANGDVFFFPSRTEVFPNNLIEAMASGLPVVTDDVGVNRAIVKDGVTGVLVKDADPLPGDVSGWLEALVDVLKNPQKRDALGMAARSSTTGLTWERTFASLRRSYDRCRPGRPYARHMDANVPWSAAAKKRRASERDFDASDASASSAGSYASGETSSGGSSLSLSGALLGISAHAAGGGGAAGALAAASALYTDHHHVSASHHHQSTAAAAAERRDEKNAMDDPDHPDHDPQTGSWSNAISDATFAGSDSLVQATTFSSHAEGKAESDIYAEDFARAVPGAGPGFVNRGGAAFRDVIVDDGAPAGSLLYRVSYGMTGGYARSLEDARLDDEAIAAAEEAAREAAKAFAAAGGRWGGGGALGGGPGFEVGGFYDAAPNEEKY